MKKMLFAVLGCGIMAFMNGCSPASVAGGGTESTNGRIVGTLVNGDGKPAAQTKVMLISNTYNPVYDGPVPDSLIDTTDESGVFELYSAPTGLFNIEALRPGSGERLLLSGVTIHPDDTVYLPVYEVKKPGAVRFIQEASGIAALKGYVYLPGTTRFAAIGSGGALIDSVPAGFVASMVYFDGENRTQDSTVAGAFTVASGNTAVVSASAVWKYSKTLFLNTTGSGAGVSGIVAEFPVLVRLSAENFDFGMARADGSDLRFIRGGGRVLPHEVERWDPVAKRAEVWVKVDTIRGNDSMQSIMMYWGSTPSTPSTPSTSSGAAGAAQSSGAAVFDTAAGFAGVWHLGHSGTGIQPDATANGTDGVATMTTAVAGAIGTAQLFNGTSSMVRASGPNLGKLNFPENGTFSVSAWVRTDVLDTLAHAIVVKSNLQYGLQLVPEHKWEFYNYIDKSGWGWSRGAVKVGSWHALTGVRNGTKQYLYVDGVRVDSSQSIVNIGFNYQRDTSQPLDIGHCPDGVNGTDSIPDRFFNGSIDEVRISGVALSADWIQLCYMNQKEQDALVKW